MDEQGGVKIILGHILKYFEPPFRLTKLFIQTARIEKSGKKADLRD
jgi:hypothetical protein